jgi:hypothetical protein
VGPSSIGVISFTPRLSSARRENVFLATRIETFSARQRFRSSVIVATSMPTKSARTTLLAPVNS